MNGSIYFYVTKPSKLYMIKSMVSIITILEDIHIWKIENGMIFDTVIDQSSHKLIILDHPDPLLIQKVLAQQLGQWLVLTKQTSFLHLDILRQDEIWFCERSRNVKLYSLNKFRIHDHDDIQKDSIIGRYHL